MSKILITPRSLTRDGDPALEKLEAEGFELLFSTEGVQPGEDELLSLVPGCTGWLAGVEKISSRVLEAAADLKVISRNGTGIDSIDLDSASRLGITIARAEGANARGVAELAVSLMFALCRSIPFSDSAMKDGKWSRQKGFEIDGRTLGLIGCGKIGKIVASLAIGLGMEVKAYDMFPDKGFNPPGDFQFADFDAVLREADIISLHCPPKDDGSPLISSAELKSMKKGVCIINTARAALVDEDALLAALETEKLFGYATDVFRTEPPAPSPLLPHEKVVTTPHIGGFTEESVSRATREAVKNILAVLKP